MTPLPPLPIVWRFVTFVAWSIVVVCALMLFGVIGCAAVPEKPLLTRVEVAPPVKIPTPILCVEQRQLPTMPKSTCKEGLDDLQKALCLDADLRELQDYSVRAEALLAGCTQALDKPKEAPK